MAEAEHPSPSVIIDREHAILNGLVSQLCKAVESGATGSQVAGIIEQLIEYSSVHFMSEELLMRLTGYHLYDEHVADHIQMMDELLSMREHHRSGHSPFLLSRARAVVDFLERHVATRDLQFTGWSLAPRT